MSEQLPGIAELDERIPFLLAQLGSYIATDFQHRLAPIGADPRTHLVHGQLDLTTLGTIAVDGRTSRTNLPGVFAAGDVIDPTYRQAVTAAGSGTVAALDAEHFLAALADVRPAELAG